MPRNTILQEVQVFIDYTEKAIEILDYILLQTEMHYTMFGHGSGMGWGRGGWMMR